MPVSMESVLESARSQGLGVLNMGLGLAQEGFVIGPHEKPEQAAERLLLIAIEKLK